MVSLSNENTKNTHKVQAISYERLKMVDIFTKVQMLIH